MTLELNLLRQLLIGVARERTFLPYKGVIKALDIPAPAMTTLTQALEILQWQDTLLNRPQIAAVVVQKKQPVPRPGFFQTARNLNCYSGPDTGTEPEMWHQDQLEKAWEFYALDETPA
ncbi:MAG: hypothetical protein WEB07_00305 [Natronospirillum sp.]